MSQNLKCLLLRKKRFSYISVNLSTEQSSYKKKKDQEIKAMAKR